MMEAEAFAAATTFYDARRNLSGVMSCLSDGIPSGDWAKLDALWQKSFSGCPTKPIGVRVVWSEKAFDREVRELTGLGMASSCTLLAGLIHCGAVIGGAVSLEAALADASIPILLLNPGCFPPEERAALEQRGAGKNVVMFGYGTDDFTENPVANEPRNWLDPLRESRPAAAAFVRARNAINTFSTVVPAPCNSDLVISGFVDEDGSMRIVARSNRTTYLMAEILVDRPVGKVEILSGYPSLPVKPSQRLKAKIPPSGVIALRCLPVEGKGAF